MRAVVVNPDPIRSRVVQFLLTEAGYDDVELTLTASSGIQAIINRECGLVVLEVDLPDLSGPLLCRQLRDRRYDGPIVVLSLHAESTLKREAMDAGADDYIVEPVAPQEFVARIQAVSRRYARQDYQPMGTVLQVGNAKLSLADLTFQLADSEPVRLTPTEVKLLECLIRNQGIAISRERLIERVWGFDYFGESNRVDVYVRRLRGKIERDPTNPEYLRTVRGVGYVFRIPERRDRARDDPPDEPPTPEDRCPHCGQLNARTPSTTGGIAAYQTFREPSSVAC